MELAVSKVSYGLISSLLDKLILLETSGWADRKGRNILIWRWCRSNNVICFQSGTGKSSSKLPRTKPLTLNYSKSFLPVPHRRRLHFVMLGQHVTHSYYFKKNQAQPGMSVKAWFKFFFVSEDLKSKRWSCIFARIWLINVVFVSSQCMYGRGGVRWCSSNLKTHFYNWPVF